MMRCNRNVLTQTNRNAVVDGGGSGGSEPSASTTGGDSPGTSHVSPSAPSSPAVKKALLEGAQSLVSGVLSMLQATATSRHRSAIERSIFTINNAYQMLSICEERRVTFEGIAPLSEAVATETAVFVEEELRKSYSGLIDFVTTVEALEDSGAASHSLPDSSVVTGLVSHFAGHWKKDLASIDADVIKYFANFKNGMDVLKQVLTQLLIYYTRFIALAKRLYPASCSGIVSVDAMMHEIKKYSRSF